MLNLAACGGSKAEEIPAEDALTWQEQFDLGIRYLSEGKYEEAIIAFTAAIEIDPKLPDAYRKAAEVYEAMGDIDSAIAMLEQGVNATGDETLKILLEEASAPVENTPVVSPEGVQLTLSLTDPNLQSSYRINKEENSGSQREYAWLVHFTDGVNTYDVGTTYFKSGNGTTEKTVTLHEMQSDLWVKTDVNRRSRISKADLTISGTTLSWTFLIPAEYNFNPDQMEVTGTTIEIAQPH